MKIAIQAADLDASRIDGTRVYIHNLLKYFGALDPSSEFFIYHKKEFNSELAPPNFPNYHIRKKDFPFLWTQICFSRQLQKDMPDVLWMPMHNIPLLRRKGLKTVVTIHDLAYKYFPDHFPPGDLIKINFLSRWAIQKSDRIIAVSESTKKDILKFYPRVKEEKIRVIHHGFDREIFEKERDLAREKEVQDELGIRGEYILYSGALQPRKNLERLVRAFEILKSEQKSGFQLVLLGEKAWLWKSLMERVRQSACQEDIILPGTVAFEKIGHVARGAKLYVFPSLYEGFGIPILEAMAAGVPVIAADNSSLREVGGDAAVYFQAEDERELARKMREVISSEVLRNELVFKGKEQAKKFSWEKCAKETLSYLSEP